MKISSVPRPCLLKFQHTATRRRLGRDTESPLLIRTVSTHSRPKAAGTCIETICCGLYCFNTQPPEGGWEKIPEGHTINDMFQHTAARRRLGAMPAATHISARVSTHSRLKAAGLSQCSCYYLDKVSTHSRLKAAGGIWVWSRPIPGFQHTAA